MFATRFFFYHIFGSQRLHGLTNERTNRGKLARAAVDDDPDLRGCPAVLPRAAEGAREVGRGLGALVVPSVIELGPTSLNEGGVCRQFLPACPLFQQKREA